MVDLNGIAVDDGEIHSVGRQGKILPGALDWKGINMEDLLAAVGLVDHDALASDQLGDKHVGLSVRDKAAEGKPAAGGGEDEGGREVGVEDCLLPHLFATHVEAADDLEVVGAVASEGNKLAAADEDGDGPAGGVEWRELAGFSGVGVEVEGPVGAALIDDGEVALSRSGDSA